MNSRDLLEDEILVLKKIIIKANEWVRANENVGLLYYWHDYDEQELRTILAEILQEDGFQ